MRLLMCAGFAWALAACSAGSHSPTAPAPAPTPPPPPRVVIISIDGLRPDALLQVGAPYILDLVRRGASTWRAQTVMPSTTLPSHASMLSGFPPSAHGLTWNDYQPGGGFIRVPTVFSAAHAAGLRTAMVVGKTKFAHLALPGTVDTYVLAPGGDADAATQAIAALQTGVDLLFVHLPQVDLAGHARGWMSQDYLTRIVEADTQVGRLVDAAPSGTTFILSADHGGHSVDHGSSRTEDMTIPWVIAGPTIAPGRNLTGRVGTADTAATALQVLGLSLPAGATGRPVVEAFGAPAPFGATATSATTMRLLQAPGRPSGHKPEARLFLR